MELQESFDVEPLFSTPTDTDWGIPMSPLPLPLPVPPSSSHMIMNKRGVAQSSAQAVAGKKLEQEFELPADFISTPTDVELVQEYLLPAIQGMPEGPTLYDLYYGPAVVKAELPFMDPWELPGIAHNKAGMRNKYYLTDHSALVLWYDTTFRQLRTPNGFWKKQTSDRVIRAGHNGVVGVKRTIKFHPSPPTSTGDDALPLSGTNTNWIMNVYYYCLHGSVQHGLVLCHVFETDSTDCDDTPKCISVGCHPGSCNGNHSGQAFGAPSSNALSNSTHPRLNSYIAELGNLLLGDPDDHDNSADTANSSATAGAPPTADHGLSKKRKKRSDVWDYFTKIFARDINGKVLTFAACNHCCKILTGSSKGGTTHLARHACPCKLKPVEAGRNAKDS